MHTRNTRGFAVKTTTQALLLARTPFIFHFYPLAPNIRNLTLKNSSDTRIPLEDVMVTKLFAV